MIKKIIILDASDNITYIKEYDTTIQTNVENFLVGHGFIVNKCQWLIVDEVKLSID